MSQLQQKNHKQYQDIFFRKIRNQDLRGIKLDLIPSCTMNQLNVYDTSTSARLSDSTGNKSIIYPMFIYDLVASFYLVVFSVIFSDTFICLAALKQLFFFNIQAQFTSDINFFFSDFLTTSWYFHMHFSCMALVQLRFHRSYSISQKLFQVEYICHNFLWETLRDCCACKKPKVLGTVYLDTDWLGERNR